MFFTLVRKQRQSGNSFINDLHVGDEYFESEEILQGWFKHFSELATPNEQSVFDFDFYNLCKKDHADIQKLYEHCKSRKTTAAEIKEALKHINKGKAEDIFGLSIENVCYAGDECIFFLEKLINAIFSHGKIPETLKTGLLSPIFKNKGDKKDSKNYRGINRMTSGWTENFYLLIYFLIFAGSASSLKEIFHICGCIGLSR